MKLILKYAVLSSGAIPIVIAGVRDVYGARRRLSRWRPY